nr:hypothetical protein BGP89_13485 [Luteimonas sp. JM171]
MSGAQLVSLLAGSISSLVNIYWIGMLGTTAQAAATLAAIPAMLVMALLPIITVGAAILMSHAVGAKDQRRANIIFNEALGVTSAIVCVMAAVAWVNREAIGVVLASHDETAALIAEYYTWFFPSMVAQVPVLIIAGAQAAIGNIRVSTIAQTGAMGLNVLLNPILMFGWVGLPAFGISGSGMASLIAYTLPLLGLIIYSCHRGSYLSLMPQMWIARPNELWSGLKLGLPVGLEGAVFAIYMFFIAVLIRPFGPIEVAAFGVGQRVLQAGLLPLLALSSATAIIVGQNYGAGASDRIRESLKSSAALALLIAPTLLAVFQLFPHWILQRFSEDAGTIESGVLLLRIDSFSLIPVGLAYIIFSVLSGMGNTKPGLYCSAAYCLSIIATSWCLSFLNGFSPVWIWKVMVVAALFQALVAALFLRYDFNRRGYIQPSFLAAGAKG